MDRSCGSSAPRSGVDRRFLDFILAIVFLGLADIALFHLGGYFAHLKPASYSGRLLESSARLDEAMNRVPRRPLVVAIGDSTAGAAIDAARVRETLRSDGLEYSAFNFSQPGSTSRSWYHLLRHERFQSSSTSLVVVAVVPTALRSFDEPKPDLQILKTELSLVDGWVLSTSYRELVPKLYVCSGTAFRTLWFRDDLRDYARNPGRRWNELRRRAEARASSRQGTGIPSGGARTGSMASVRLDDEGRLVVSELPPHLRDRTGIHGQLELWLRGQRRPADVPIDFDPHKLRMLEALVETLDGRGVPVLIAVLPKMRAVFRHREIAILRQTVKSLQRAGRQVHWFEDAELLNRLEQPEYYSDHLHLNARGAELYSAALGAAVAERLQRLKRVSHRPLRPRQSGTESDRFMAR